MVTVILRAKNSIKYTFSLEKGADILLSLDIFLKESKLVLSDLKNVSVSCEEKESMACRTAHISVQSLKCKMKDF